VNIGTISRLLCSIGYFGWNPNVLSSDLFNIFYTETYSFWIVGWVFVIGVWTDVIGASKLEIALKRAPIIISVGGGILFVIFQVIVITFILKFQVDLFTNIFNVVLALVLLSGCILIPIFGFKLLDKIRTFNQKGIDKLRRKTKFLMASAFIFATIFIILIVFIILEDTVTFSPMRYLVFQVIFRIGEICVVPTILLLATGNSLQKTLRACCFGDGKDKNTDTAKTQDTNPNTNDSRDVDNELEEKRDEEKDEKKDEKKDEEKDEESHEKDHDESSEKDD